MYVNSVLSSNDLCVKIKYCNSFKWTNQAEIEAKKNCPLGSQEKSKANSLHGRLLWCDYVKIIKTVSSPSYMYIHTHTPVCHVSQFVCCLDRHWSQIRQSKRDQPKKKNVYYSRKNRIPETSAFASEIYPNPFSKSRVKQRFPKRRKQSRWEFINIRFEV